MKTIFYNPITKDFTVKSEVATAGGFTASFLGIKHLEKVFIDLETYGITKFSSPIAYIRQIRLKNLGINTAMIDNYTLKFISKN